MQLINPMYKKNDDLAWRIIEGEAFVIHPQHGLIYPLNSVATRIWELVDGKKTPAQIIEIMQQEFEEEEDVIANDASAFLQDLCKADLIATADAK